MRRRLLLLLAMLTLGGASQGNAVQAASSPRLLGSAPRPRIAPPVANPDELREIDPWTARIQARLADLSPLPRAAAPTGLQADRAGALASKLAPLGRGVGRGAQVGLHVRDLRTGESLLDAAGDRALNPASNHKLLTAIAALELLGPEYRFETRVLLDGDDLVLVGEGDPSLQSEHLAQLAQAVRDQIDLSGVRRIVIDDGRFSPERFGPGYDAGGPGYSYMAPSGALSVQWNTIEITAVPEDGAVKVYVDPPCAHVRVVSEATLARRTALDIETAAVGDETVVSIRGTLARRAGVETLRRRVGDPGRFAASVFAAALGPDAAALPIVRGRAGERALPLAEHRSAPLAEVLHSALKFSNNFTTEQVLRTLGWRMTGSPGSWANGTLALREFWRATGGDAEALVFENASGYSRTGRTSARALVDLLAWSQRPGSRSAALVGALAVSGIDGTMRDRLHDATGRVFAKTGTLAGASALSGIVVDASGAPSVAFSVLVNGPVTGHAAHALQDRVVRLLLEPSVARG
jgi:D-alanyl-D-alanine carboxypeptidase/D-alanyl-D-alanine-endopeptidase (penicillin-binding protein 4)